MSGNGELIKPKKEEVVILEIVSPKGGGSMKVKFGTGVPIATITLALKLANLEVDNYIIGQTMPKPQVIPISQGVMDKLRGK